MPDARGGVAALAIIGEGSYYSAGAFTAEDVIPTEAVSVGRTDMARFEVGRIRKAFQGDQTIADFLVQLVARRLMATIGSYRDVVAAPLPERLARRLLSHALAAGHTRDEVELRVTQGDLAEMLGAGRGQVAAELRQLESDGAIRLGYRSVRVRDFQRLCEAAGPGVLPF